MKMHQIEVDDEVYNYLKVNAEPFVDTPNSVLRRKLLGESLTSEEISKAKSDLDKIFKLPAGTPSALQQILQVACMVRNFNYSRQDATRKVAAVHHIAPQTVIDKYCRQLNLTAPEFDNLLDQSDLQELKKRLTNKFSLHKELIERYLGG